MFYGYFLGKLNFLLVAELDNIMVQRIHNNFGFILVIVRAANGNSRGLVLVQFQNTVAGIVMGQGLHTSPHYVPSLILMKLRFTNLSSRRYF